MTVSGAYLSGQITVTTAGTAVHETGDMASIAGQFWLKAHPSNAGIIAIGNDGAGDVTVSNGLILAAGDIIHYAGMLTNVWVDAATNGDKLCWFRIG